MPVLGPDTNKKKVAALILARVKPSGQTETMGESGDGSSPDSSISEGERSAGEDAIAAIHSKDVAAFVSAIKNLLDIIDDDDGPAEEIKEEKPGFIG